jgi:hypothetical protein
MAIEGTEGFRGERGLKRGQRVTERAEVCSGDREL